MGHKTPSVAKLSSAFPYFFYFPAAAITSSRKKHSYLDQAEAKKFVTQAGRKETPDAGDYGEPQWRDEGDEPVKHLVCKAVG